MMFKDCLFWSSLLVWLQIKMANLDECVYEDSINKVSEDWVLWDRKYGVKCKRNLKYHYSVRQQQEMQLSGFAGFCGVF